MAALRAARGLAVLFWLLLMPGPIVAGSCFAAEVPAGIVMAVSGAMLPRLAVHGEIAADSGVKLGAGATLTFLHYERCKLVTVTGGTVVLTRTDYATDGRTISEAPTGCPQVQVVGHGAPPPASPGSPSAAVLPNLPERPEFILTGPRAARVATITIAEDGRVRPAGLRLDLAKGRATLPAGTSLRANTRYALQVDFTDRSPPVALPFTAVPDGSLVILRTE